MGKSAKGKKKTVAIAADSLQTLQEEE